MRFRTGATSVVFAGALLGALSAHAVTLNPRGMGQVLLYPYYTVNGGNDTLVSLANTTGSAKAVRVRVAEGENGRDAASINVYLAPFDTWTAAITRLADGTPGIVSSDDTCTLPEISTYSGSALSIGTGSLAFSDAAWTGAHADASDDPLAVRAGEGSIEAIEMGVLVATSGVDAATRRAATGSAGACNALYNAWVPPGFANLVTDGSDVTPALWNQHPAADLTNPTGGLYGTAYVVNVARGTVFSYAATALEDFRADPADRPRGTTASVVMHTPSGTAQPDLSSALDDPSDGSADADVVADGAMVRATYPAAHAIDAVTAVLTVGQADGEYTADPALGATTSFVFSYPTRRFYTDPALAGSAAIAPFSNLFAGNRRGVVSERLPYTSYAPDGASPLINCGVDLCANRLLSPGTSVEVLDLGAGAGAMLDSARTMQFDGAGASPAAFSASGRMFLAPDLALLFPTGTDDPLPALRFMRPSSGGQAFAGLPLIAFAATNFVNADVQGGVLANYSAASSLRTATSCWIYTPNGHPPHCG
ncbi:hypothetical protein FHW12_002317 [Dokdonella fugitiva]|uniref:Uncharacterized protein n=1 Tax=Dokdonella fugitiva TaxID=328517 RepID=A0A839EZK1_9GAMM|nr:hypothetical protein [Dokdonella fugitiva]MBA8888093.1 hypothetical protein [Dokdonella fugitiva]